MKVVVVSFEIDNMLKIDLVFGIFCDMMVVGLGKVFGMFLLIYVNVF